MTATVAASPLDTRRNWAALFSLTPAALAVGLDATITSIALPTLADEFGASTAQLQWFTVSYALAFAAALIPVGLLADRWGRKRTLLAALVLFGAASAACAYAPSAGAFIAARVLLGIGGAAVLPSAMASLPTLFSPAVRPRALTALMAVTMLGFPVGPLLGGYLLSHAWWGWAFLINVPMVVLAIVSVALLLPESRGTSASAVDVPGIVVSSAGLASLTYGATLAGERGWGSASAWAWMLGGLALGAAFVWWERRVHSPLVDLSLFSHRAFSAGTFLASALSFVMFGLMFTVPLFAQGVQGADAQGAGIRLLPLVVGMLLAAPTADRLVPRFGARPIVGLGLVVMAAALFVGSTTHATSGTGLLVAWVGLAGVGLGLALPTSMDAALGALSAGAEGTGSAVVQAARMVAGSLGAAVLGSVVAARYASELPDALLAPLPADAAEAARSGLQGALAVAHGGGLDELVAAARDAFTSGVDAMLVVAGVLALASALAALALPARRARGAAESEA